MGWINGLHRHSGQSYRDNLRAATQKTQAIDRDDGAHLAVGPHYSADLTVGQLLRSSHHRFIFLHRDFVEHYLDTCRAGDPKLLERAIDQLEAAAVSGSWSGTVGEPMPRDLETRDEATAILASMSRLSAAYALYRDVLRDAKRNIEKSHAQAAAYEDEE